MEPVEAIPVADSVALFDTERPGVFCIMEDKPEAAILFECPCGCGTHCRLSLSTNEEVAKAGSLVYGHPVWHWDGNRERPTLSPSIRQLSGCYTHGHLQKGFWTFEADSGVKP